MSSERDRDANRIRCGGNFVGFGGSKGTEDSISADNRSVHRYAHLITSDWDERFLTTPSFRTWFENQVQVTPMEEGELLVDYVRVQIESARVAGEPSVMENGADAGEDSLALFDMESYSADAPAFENYAENGGSMAYSSLYSPSNESATQQAYFAQQSAIAAHQQQSGTIAPQSIDPTVVAPAASSRGGSRPTPYVEISVASGTTATVRPTPSSSRSAPPVASTPAPAAKKLAPVAASRTVKKPSPAPVASTSTLPHADPWEKAIPVIRESLTVVRLTRAVTSTSTKLAGILSAYTTDKDTKWGDKSMVPLSGRIEVLQLLGSAKEEFWKAWLEKGAEGGMETMMIWFIGASDKSKTPNSAERQILVLLLNVSPISDLRSPLRLFRTEKKEEKNKTSSRSIPLPRGSIVFDVFLYSLSQVHDDDPISSLRSSSCCNSRFQPHDSERELNSLAFFNRSLRYVH